MQLCYGHMACLALFAVVLALTVTGTEAGDKVHNCCTEVSRKQITVPIIGYRIQYKNPPCVNAVIFETEKGEVCSHWKQAWVFKRVKELEKARKELAAGLAMNTSHSPNTGSLATTASSS